MGYGACEAFEEVVRECRVGPGAGGQHDERKANDYNDYGGVQDINARHEDNSCGNLEWGRRRLRSEKSLAIWCNRMCRRIRGEGWVFLVVPDAGVGVILWVRREGSQAT